jgi:YVTN family beta-propeller protein
VNRRIEFPVELTGSVVSPDGRTLYVTGGGAQGQVFVVDTASGDILKVIPVGHTPNAPVLSPDGEVLYVCNRFNNNVSIIDLKRALETSRVCVAREPVAADISKDGRWLFVGNHLPNGRADTGYIASEVSVIDTHTGLVKSIPLVNGAEGLRGLKVSPDGQTVFAVHYLARYQVPITQLDRGWVSTDALSVIRVSDHTLVETILLDDLLLGFPNPWAIDFTADGEHMLVTAAGSHELSVIQLPELMQKIEANPAQIESADEVKTYNNLSFFSDIRQRVRLSGNGPRALAVWGSEVYVANYFSDSIDVLDLTKPQLRTSMELNPDLEVTQIREGEILFNDATHSMQQWLSCATCHPDGRADGLNWDVLNDGMGNPKNVKSILYTDETLPTAWLGIRENLEIHVRKALKFTLFSGLSEEKAQSIDAYLKAARPMPSPYLVNGALSDAALRGKRVFEVERCQRCHMEPYFTDAEMHEVGTTRGVDAGKAVDTPSLLELWRSAPYLHDGRAATVRDVLLNETHANIETRINRLNDDEIDDLEAFLLSL